MVQVPPLTPKLLLTPLFFHRDQTSCQWAQQTAQHEHRVTSSPNRLYETTLKRQKTDFLTASLLVAETALDNEDTCAG